MQSKLELNPQVIDIINNWAKFAIKRYPIQSYQGIFKNFRSEIITEIIGP